ncbi:hypothetical protein BD779DRAFT_1611439 [Infundibulicybe gibba]|nr:hypothetical protein BD779DRAFT_1611439 [Infundibulicybe gibba]
MSTAQASTSSRSRNQVRKKPNDNASYFGPQHQQARVASARQPTRRTVEFTKMPTPVLYRYLAQFDIVPHIYPSPLSPEDPPPPTSLTHFHQHPSRVVPSPPPATPANRPRRDPKEQTRRRSLRLLEEDVRARTPVLADVEELHTVLAGMVEHHFQDLVMMGGREEVDTLVSFMCAVEKVKAARHR